MDTVEIKSKIKQNLLSLIIVGIAVFIALKIYHNKEKEIVVLKNQKESERMKNEVLNEISALEKELAYFDEKINTKQLSSSLDKISDFAKTYSVDISKITPLKEINMGVYTKYPFEMFLSATSYHQLAEFVSVLENSPDIYIVENLVISGNIEGKADSVTASLSIATILINK